MNLRDIIDLVDLMPAATDTTTPFVLVPADTHARITAVITHTGPCTYGARGGLLLFGRELYPLPIGDSSGTIVR